MSDIKKPPFQKSPPPLSYAEGPRLSRVIEVLSPDDQQRFWKGYRAHIESEYYASIQRQGHLICLIRIEDDSSEVFDFGTHTNAQRCISALTDCFRGSRVPIKVLMPESAPKP